MLVLVSVSVTALPVKRLEGAGGGCDLGELKAGCPHSLVSVIKKTKMIFKELVLVWFIPVLDSWPPLNHSLINTVTMAPKLSITQEAAFPPPVGSSLISTLWTSY